MSWPTYQLKANPLLSWDFTHVQPITDLKKAGRKFAFGYFFGKRNGFSFRELAEQYAPFMKEVSFSWPGLLSSYELKKDVIQHRGELIDDLKYCRAKGLALDLLVNAACYGDEAFKPAQRESYFNHLKELSSHGIMPEIVTTTSPYIATISKKYDSAIDRRASVNMRIKSTLAMEYVAETFDSFYICRDLQRDLPTVKTFADWAKKNGKNMCMLVNSGCLRDCPWQTFHGTLLAHDFQHVQAESERLKMPSTLCAERIQDRQYEEILRASWIRPEDLSRYEAFVSVFNLSTHDADRPDLILNAYSSGSFDGDLLLLLDPGFFKFIRPNIFDNKSFPKEWSKGEIAGRCANNCTHYGKCEQVLEQVLKYDVNHDMRASTLSFAQDSFLLAPKRKVSEQIKITPGFQ